MQFRDEEMGEYQRRALRESLGGLEGEFTRLYDAAVDYRSEREILRLVAGMSAREGAAVRDPDAYVRSALDAIREMPRVEQGCVVLFDADSAAPTVLYSFGLDGTDQSVLMEQISQGVIGRVRETGQEVYSEEAFEDELLQDLASVREKRIRTVFCCPVPDRREDCPRGAIYIENRKESDAFPEVWRESVRLLAAQMAQKLALAGCRVDAEVDRTATYREGGRFREFVGFSAATAWLLQELQELIERDLDSMPVLITGESGVGKDVLARCIQRYGARRDGPLVTVGAATLTPGSACKALFGEADGRVEPGGAESPGLFHEANGGILVFDGVEDLPGEVQAQLLRAIEDRRIRKVGSATFEEIDVWIVALSRVDLPTAVKDGGFHEALMHRLHRRVIHVPPLRERRDDIAPLARHFTASSRSGSQHGRVLTPDLLAELRRRRWPGNARELQAVIDRVVRSAPGPLVSATDLERVEGERPRDEQEEVGARWDDVCRRFRRDYLAWALREFGPSVANVARELGINRTHLYELCKKHGVPIGKAER